MLLALLLCCSASAATGPEGKLYDIDIASPNAAEALNALAAQTGASFLFPYDLAKKRQASAVSGRYTLLCALNQLLQGSGLGSDLSDNGVIRIFRVEESARNDRGKVVKSEHQKANTKTSLVAGIAAFFASFVAAPNVMGQEGDAGRQSVLEEIIVTAERRQERAQDVPISMSVFSGDFIKQYIGDQFELANLTPNYQIASQGFTVLGRTTMRGLGNVEQPSAGPSHSILTYYDGLAESSALAATFPQWDLDRIEVQRGPQGTLYGRNAIGGLIHYHSAAPTDEFEGFAETTFGEYDLRRFEGAVSGPLTETAKARLSALSYDRDGDITNTFYNEKQNGRDWWGVRGIVDWQITGNFDARMKAQHFDGESTNWLFNVMPSDLLSPDFVGFYEATGSDPDLARNSDFEKDRSGLDNPVARLDVQIAELDLNYDFGPVGLAAIGGYIVADFDYGNEGADTLHLPVPNTLLLFNEHEQRSGEIRLTSQTDNSLQWIAGAFYHYSELFTRATFDNTGIVRDLDGDGRTRHNADSPEDLLDGILPAISGFPTLASDTSSNQELETYAFFLHTTFDWTERLTTTHAVRWTNEELSFDAVENALFEFPLSLGVTGGSLGQFNDFVRFARLTPAEQRQQAVTIISDPNTLDANGNVIPRHETETWDELTWRFAADYRLAQDRLVYASISRGFKAGAGLTGASVTPFFVDPETSTVYEVGTKTEWLNNRLQVNAGAFYNDHEGYQTLQFVPRPDAPIAATLSNLPEVEIYGGELEIRAVPMENLLVVANLGLTETEITKVLPGNEEILGNELPYVEDVNFSGLVRYDIDNALGTFSPQISWRYRSDFWSLKENNDPDVIKPGDFWTTDVRVGYESPDGKLYGMLYWKNIFNEVRPVTNALPTAVLGTSLSFVNNAERRNWGVTVGYRF